MNVLIVDDEIIELEQLTYLLQKRYPDWELFQAEDAAEAKRLVDQHSFKLALLDIYLPGESGLDLAAFLKQKNNMAIIFITAYDEFEYAQRAVRLHAFDFLMKPVVEKELFTVIDRFRQDHHIHATNSALVNQVAEYIQENYGERLTLNSLAKTFHVNPSYLSRKFSEEMSVNLLDYIHDFRIQKGKELLNDHRGISMAMVAEKVGYQTQNHFNHQFKKHTGMTPGQYQRSL